MNPQVLMRMSLLGSLLFWAAVSYSQLGRGPQGPRVVSPEILSDKKVTFQLVAPKAGSIEAHCRSVDAL